MSAGRQPLDNEDIFTREVEDIMAITKKMKDTYGRKAKVDMTAMLTEARKVAKTRSVCRIRECIHSHDSCVS